MCILEMIKYNRKGINTRVHISEKQITISTTKEFNLLNVVKYPLPLKKNYRKPFGSMYARDVGVLFIME